jgi:hypothetical protein
VGRAELALFGSFVLAIGSPARADDPLPALIVTRAGGASDCPDAAQLAAEVARMNGAPALDATGKTASPTRLHVEISRGLDGYSAVIRALGARSGERRLSDAGPSCKNLADALALTLAIILDAKQASIEPTPRAFEPRLRASSESLASSNRRTSGDVGAAIGLHAGLLAETGLLFTALGRIDLGELITLEAGGFVTSEQSVDHVGSDGKLSLRLLSGFLGVCARLASDRSRIALAACAEPYLGWLRGTGAGFDHPRPAQNHVWLAGGIALDLDGAISGPLRWHVRGAGLAVVEERFVVGVDGEPEPDTVFVSSPAALLASAGLRLNFE